MATTYATIERFLEKNACAFHYDESHEFLVTGFRTQNYVSEEGENAVAIIIRLEEDGEFLKVFAPAVYHVKESSNRLAVFFSLLHICWQTKMLQYEFDPSDGEVRAIIEFPLEDAELTEKQFMRILLSLGEMVDRYDPIIRGALDTGVVDFRLLAPELDGQLAELFTAMSEAGGIDELKKIIEDAVQRRARGEPTN